MTTPLIDIRALPVEFDLRYATSDNFTGKPIYDRPVALLHQDAAALLEKAARMALAFGHKLLIYDGYRPQQAQERLWAIMPDPEFVADPSKGSDHTRGVAVDLTLIDPQGRVLDMGTEFDAAAPQSHHGRLDIPAEAAHNRALLLGVMAGAGFRLNPNEWWHYSLWNSAAYPLLKGKEYAAPVMA